MTPLTNISSSSPDEAVMPPPPPMADDCRQFQELIKRIVGMLQILFEVFQVSHHKLLDILQTLTSMRLAIPGTEALMEPTKTV